jgi:peptidyl-prolyl cis-trans isomerase C
MNLKAVAVGILGLALGAGLMACGQGGKDVSNLSKEVRRGQDPVVAATVNGTPIFLDDVTVEAVVRGQLKLGEEIDPTSDDFYQILQDLVETRLLAQEAEARGLDKAPDVKHRLEIARERILANVLNEHLRDTILTDAAVKRFYRENLKLLGRGQLVHARHILLASKEGAIAAKLRLDRGEPFETVAYEVSIDRTTGGEGGDLGFKVPDNYPEALQDIMKTAPIGQVIGPIQSDIGWHLVRVEERRQQEPPSLESMRGQLEANLWFPEQRRVVERLRGAARIELFVDDQRRAGVAARPGIEAPAEGGSDSAIAPAAPSAKAPAAAEPAPAAPPVLPLPLPRPLAQAPKQTAPDQPAKPAPLPLPLKPGDEIAPPTSQPKPGERET